MFTNESPRDRAVSQRHEGSSLHPRGPQRDSSKNHRTFFLKPGVFQKVFSFKLVSPLGAARFYFKIQSFSTMSKSITVFKGCILQQAYMTTFSNFFSRYFNPFLLTINQDYILKQAYTLNRNKKILSPIHHFLEKLRNKNMIQLTNRNQQ